MSDTDDFSKDAEWLEALEADPVDPPADDKKDDDDDKGNDGNADDDTGADDTAEDDKPEVKADGAGEDSPADDAKGDDAPADGAAKEGDEADGPSTPTEDERLKEAVKEALRETETAKADQSTKAEGFKLEVAQTLYPEGLDRTLRDSDGDPIRDIDDVTKLINPKTQDYFTDEEAGAWLLSAQKKLNEDVTQVEKFIEDVAEVHLRLEDGAARVVEKYGDYLTKNPETKNRLLQAYNKTLTKDPKSGLAINDPIEVVEFFDLALEPILANQTAEAEAAAKATKEAEAQARKNRQTDRGDLKQSGKADVIPEEDKEWATAIKDYEQGV